MGGFVPEQPELRKPPAQREQNAPADAQPAQPPEVKPQMAEMPWVTAWRYAAGKFFRPFDPWHWIGTIGFYVALDYFFLEREYAILAALTFFVGQECVEFVTNFLKGPPAPPPADDPAKLPKTKPE